MTQRPSALQQDAYNKMLTGLNTHDNGYYLNEYVSCVPSFGVFRASLQNDPQCGVRLVAVCAKQGPPDDGCFFLSPLNTLQM